MLNQLEASSAASPIPAGCDGAFRDPGTAAADALAVNACDGTRMAKGDFLLVARTGDGRPAGIRLLGAAEFRRWIQAAFASAACSMLGPVSSDAIVNSSRQLGDAQELPLHLYSLGAIE